MTGKGRKWADNGGVGKRGPAKAITVEC